MIPLSYQRKTRYFIFLYFFFLVIESYSQQPDIIWGKELDGKNQSDIIFLKKDPVSQSTQWLVSEDNHLYIATFDSNQTKISSKPLKFPMYNGMDVGQMNFVKILPVQNRIIFLMLYWDRPTDIARHYILEATIEGEVKENFIQVAECPARKGKMKTVNDIFLSPDSSKILTSIVIPKQKDISQTRYILNVINSDMISVYSKEYELPSKHHMVYGQGHTIIDQEYHVFIVNKFKDSIDKKKPEHYNITRIDMPTGIIEEIPLNDIQDKKIDDIVLCNTPKGNVVVSGFYRDKNNFSNFYTGVFFASIDHAENFNMKTSEFSTQENLTRDSPDLLIKSVNYIVKNDGGLILLSEQIIVDHNNKRFGNIFIADLDKNGSIRFSKTVLKNQVSLFQLQYSFYYSYYSIYDEGQRKLTLLYNDNPKNADSSTYTRQMKPGSSFPFVVELDSNGLLKKCLIKSSGQEILCPLFTTKISDKEFLVFGKDNDHFRLGLLKLPDTLQNVLSLYNKPDIGFVGAHLYGLRLRLNDAKEKHKKFTGLNLVLVRSYLKKSSGISLGILVNSDKIHNGFFYGTFLAKSDQLNGISISPFLAGSKKVHGLIAGALIVIGGQVNGIIISGFMAGSDNIQGAAVSPFVVSTTIKGIGISLAQNCTNAKGIFLAMFSFTNLSSRRPNGRRGENNDNHMNGITLTGLCTDIDFVKGVTISAINSSKHHKGLSFGLINVTKKLKGIQFGLLNYVGNNPIIFRFLPFINMHWKADKVKGQP